MVFFNKNKHIERPFNERERESQQCIQMLFVFHRDFLITVPASVYRGEEFDFCVTFPGTFQDGSVEVNAQMQLDDTDVVRYPPQTYLTGWLIYYYYLYDNT